jgi:hypothetical protein
MLATMSRAARPLVCVLGLVLLLWWTSFPCLLAAMMESGGDCAAAKCGLGRIVRESREREARHACSCCWGHAADAPADAPDSPEEPCRCPCTVFGGCKRDLPAQGAAPTLDPPAAQALLALAGDPPLAGVEVLARPARAARHGADPPRLGPSAGLALRI